MIAIRYSGVIFAAYSTCRECATGHVFSPDAVLAPPSNNKCQRCGLTPDEVTVRVCARGGKHIATIVGEENARRWLGDRGLRRSKGRALMRAVLRNAGPFANPNHPKRIK